MINSIKGAAANILSGVGIVILYSSLVVFVAQSVFIYILLCASLAAGNNYFENMTYEHWVIYAVLSVPTLIKVGELFGSKGEIR